MASRYRGPLTAYRIADSRFPIFDGMGAAMFGARWNSPGHRVIYCGLTFAGCMIEQLAHAQTGSLPGSQQWVEVTVPGSVQIEEITSRDVPGWSAPDFIASRAFGDRWIVESRTCVLVVPAVTGRPVEKNVLINPGHADFRVLKASRPSAVVWDKRLRGPK